MSRAAGPGVWWRLTRPFTLLPPLLGMLSGAAAAVGASRGTMDRALAANLVLGSLMAVLLNAASNVLNQIHDLEIDRVNKPERPLPSGEVGISGARRLAAVLYLASLALAALVQPAGRPELLLIVALTALLTWAYSAPPLRLRRSWWAGPLVIAVPRGGLLKVAGWACVATVADPEPWVLAALFFLFILGAAPTKDFEDLEGDRRGGVQSLPLRFGSHRAAWIMAPFYVLPWMSLALLGMIGNGAGGILSVGGGGALLAGGFLAVHGLMSAIFLVRRSRKIPVALGRGVWINLYVLMMEAQVILAVLYLC